jgi:phage terminase small subunit
MNKRQSKFVTGFIKTGNATESAMRAGYSSKTAYSIGQRLLKNVEIIREIDMHREAISKKADLTVSQVVREIWQLARQAQSETNRLRAYDMLMKHLGGYVTEKMIIENLTEEQLNELYDRLSKKLDNEYQ